MQVSRDGAPQYGGSNSAETQDHDLDGGSVFGGHAEGRRVLVVDFMDVFVERTPVEGAVGPVVPCVFEDKEDGDLVGHRKEGWEGNAGCEAEVLGHRVEQPYQVSDRRDDTTEKRNSYQI